MKLYKWKPHTPKPNPDDPDDTNGSTERITGRPAKKRRKAAKKDETPWKWTLPKSEIMTQLQAKAWTKRQIVLRLYHEHPLVTLRVGTLTANVRGVCDDLAGDVTACLRGAVKIIVDVKRQAQELIGGFVQRVVVEGHEVSGEDRELLDAICPRLAKPEPGSNDGNDVSDDAEEDEDDKSLQYQFLYKLLGHLFSGNVRNDNATGRLLQRFINRASGFNLCQPYSISPTRHQPPFPASVLWSVTKELAKEIKMLYKGGCENIQKQVISKGHHILCYGMASKQTSTV